MVDGNEIERILDSHLKDGLFTHCFASWGDLTGLTPSQQLFVRSPGTRGEIFDLASLTKCFSTLPLVMKSGLDINTPISNLVEEDDLPLSKYTASLSLLDLMKHKTGLPFWSNFWMSCEKLGFPALSWHDRNGQIRTVFQRISDNRIGKKEIEIYSDLGYILIGFLLEKLNQVSLKELFEKLLDSMQLSNRFLGFLPNNFHCSQIGNIPTTYCSLRKKILDGEVHDENCWFLGSMAGHAGLFGTGKDVTNFIEKFFVSPLGKKYWSLVDSFGVFGFPSTTSVPDHILQHLGFTGTGFWLDRKSLRYGLLLTNRIISGRLSSNIADLRSQFVQSVFFT